MGRRAHGTPLTRADEPLVLERFHRESASSCWAFATRRNGVYSARPAGATGTTLDPGYATLPPFHRHSPAKIASPQFHPIAPRTAEGSGPRLAARPPRSGAPVVLTGSI